MFFKLYILFVVVHLTLQRNIQNRGNIQQDNTKYEFCAEKCQSLVTRYINCKETKILDCLLKIHNGTAHFTTVTYENAWLIAAFLPDLEVVAKFHPDIGNSFDGDGVVVVRKNLFNGLKGLQGYKYCAPGQNALHEVSKNFQDTLLKKFDINICDIQGESILEKKLGSLSNLLGPSCLPGQWVENIEYDQILKRKYSKLVKLCGGLSRNEMKNDPALQSFNCFLNGEGDVVALTNHRTVQNHVMKRSDISQYRYLCPNDYLETWNGSCSWKRQETLLITNREISAALSKILNVWFKDYLLHPKRRNLDSRYGVRSLTPHDSRNIKDILFPNKSKIIVFDDAKPLGDYVKGISRLNENKLCGLDIKWCTISSNEQEKCNWLARAAASYDIKPNLVCIQENSSSACLQAIRTGKVDVARVDIKIYSGLVENLQVLKYLITNNTSYEYVVITKSVFLEEDIKGKRGCYSGIGQAKSIKYDIRNSEAIECFHQSGDFAVLAKNDNCYKKECNAVCWMNGKDYVYRIYLKLDDLNLNTTYTLLCENGEALQYSEDVLSNCTWSIPMTVLVSQKRSPKIKEIDIFLFEIVRHFVERKDSAFRLFEDFKGKSDLLFLSNTVALSDLRNDVHPTVQAYNKLLRYLNYSNNQANLSLSRFIVIFNLFYLLYLY